MLKNTWYTTLVQDIKHISSFRFGITATISSWQFAESNNTWSSINWYFGAFWPPLSIFENWEHYYYHGLFPVTPKLIVKKTVKNQTLIRSYFQPSSSKRNYDTQLLKEKLCNIKHILAFKYINILFHCII